jgi:hypothetical protein
MGRSSRFWKIIVLAEIILPVAVVLCAVGGTFTALKLEEQDGFCAACHTQPEVTYFQQAQSSPITLAAFHAQVGASSANAPARCIDCHSGAGTFGRASGLMQGAHDLVAYLSRNYRAPAVTTNPLSDASCSKCHADVVPTQVVTKVSSLKSHYHDFLPRWHQLDPHAARCADCHVAHTQGNAADSFLDNGSAGKVCENCHRALSGKVEE